MARRPRRNSAARYAKPIDIVRREVKENEYGEPVKAREGLEVIRRVWADVQPLAGRETVEGDRQQPIHSHRITTRHIPGFQFDTGLSLRYHDGTRDRILDIAAEADTGERHDEIVLLCSESK